MILIFKCFVNQANYNLIKADDIFNFLDLIEFSLGETLIIEAVHTDGIKD
ncbi:hypothetical protein [uncultured Polaribacter sp.]|nr:hypothetical protein [uncultured Polaribacter sp.]